MIIIYLFMYLFMYLCIYLFIYFKNDGLIYIGAELGQ